ncbi:ankyrin [Byssothecium circinans]|uniref:Ankyrin n=1 Tax=Byssothecium circinans TaxID=147558 RepID=A0A6A5TJ82_9PLEO|nr:ankyrin [Byssothecium circinans]
MCPPALPEKQHGRLIPSSGFPTSGRTPLLWAVMKGHETVVKLLLYLGRINVDSKDKYRLTPLSEAAGNRHEVLVELLLDTGRVDAGLKDTLFRKTPLSWAVYRGQEAVVRLLLDTGRVDIDWKDDYGRT